MELGPKTEALFAAPDKNLKKALPIEWVEIPNYYSNQEAHDTMTAFLAEQAFVCLTFALDGTLENDEYKKSQARYYLNEWARVNQGVVLGWWDKSAHLGFFTVMHNMILAAIILDWKPGYVTHWIRRVFKPAVNTLIKHTPNNNWYAWGLYGQMLLAVYFEKNGLHQELLDIKEYIEDNKNFIPFLTDKDTFLHENLRHNSGIWYTYYTLAPLTFALSLGKAYARKINLPSQYGVEMIYNLYSRLKPFIVKNHFYVNNPDKWPYKNWGGAVQRFVFPGAKELKLPDGNREWPYNMLCGLKLCFSMENPIVDYPVTWGNVWTFPNKFKQVGLV